MMATAEDLLEELLEKQLELVRAKKGSEKEAALEQRIAELEARFEAKPKEERDDAIEEITDEEYDLIRQHRAGTKPEPVVDPEPVVEQQEKKKRPGRKSGQAYHWTVDEQGNVKHVDIPHVYNGADEDEFVDLPEDEAAA
jgi:hypothetical protein